MMARIQTLIFYALMIALLVILYHVVASFGFVIVGDSYRNMETAIKAKETLLIDQRSGLVELLKVHDIIAYSVTVRGKRTQMFGRVIALPGSTVSVRERRLLVEGTDVAPASKELKLLETGLMVPRNTVFVTFDSPHGASVPITQRLVPFRKIIGRVIGE